MATAAISATPVSDLRARGVKGSTTWQQAWQAGAQRRMESVEPTGEALGDSLWVTALEFICTSPVSHGGE